MTLGLFFIIYFIVLISISDTACQLFLKSAINRLKFEVSGIRKAVLFILKLAASPGAWAALFFSIVSLALWLFILSHVDLNFAFSVDSMHYIFIAFASRLILKERVGTWRWAGTLLIVAGIILVTLS